MTASSLETQATDLVRIEVSGDASRTVLTAAGEVDSTSAPVLRGRLDAALDAGTPEVTVDLHGVTFLDSAGLCVLAAAHRRASRDGIRLHVLASSRAVVRPLQITGLFALLGVVTDASGAA